MLPRTARAGLLARRQFHHSSIQLAAVKSSKSSKPSKSLKPTPKSNGQAVAQASKPKEKQREKEMEDSAEKVAREALMNFFRSSLPAQAKGKAAQARHYGTFSAMREEMLLIENTQEKKKGEEDKKEKPVTPESDEELLRQKERIDEASQKASATDKMKEDEPKDDKEVSYPCDIFY
jgi:type IV secretory pathway VirB10-like protein